MRTIGSVGIVGHVREGRGDRFRVRDWWKGP